MKEKIKNVVVSSNETYVIWSENIDEIARDTTLNVEAGCIALYIVNGVLKSINTPGRWLIKSKEEEKSKPSLKDNYIDLLIESVEKYERNPEVFIAISREIKKKFSSEPTMSRSLWASSNPIPDIDANAILYFKSSINVF